MDQYSSGVARPILFRGKPIGANEFFLNLQGLEEKASPQLVGGRVRIFIAIARFIEWTLRST